MGKKFNTTGSCLPDRHYMVSLDDRLKIIKEQYVDEGSFFVINRGRQYGKTTTLRALAKYLRNDYIVIFMDFQMMSTASFAEEGAFVKTFISCMEDLFFENDDLTESVTAESFQNLINLKQQEGRSLDEMFRVLSRICRTASKPIVLMVDEVDSASNNQVFVDFLSQLMGYYLARDTRPGFHSVILAGVYDIKNLKQKIRSDDEHKYNSPWNIAADFKVSLRFSPVQIAGMLVEYEKDHHTGMNIKDMAEALYQYTAGYPYLVSALCKIIDEELLGMDCFDGKSSAWSRDGITESVKILLNRNLPLFDSMVKQLDLYPDMCKAIKGILYQGKQVPFSPDAKELNMGIMFGFLKEENGRIAISNRIFEMRILNLFLAEESLHSEEFAQGERSRNQFITNGKLNMEQVLAKFVEYFHDIYGDKNEKFVEEHGRRYFLLYLKPIINGTGNYYLEAQTRDEGRTDVVVDYLGEQFVIEMKIWRGAAYHERGERQLAEYLDYFHLKKGYMLSFNFNKKKEIGMKTIQIGNKYIIEATV